MALTRKTPMKRTELKTGPCTLKRSQLRQVSAKQAAMKKVRIVSERDLGRDANGEGVCARCGMFGEVHGHELRNRSHGGDAAHPDCLLCNPCNELAENGNRRTMVWTGWKIDPRYPHDPALEIGQAWALDGSLVVFSTVSTDGLTQWSSDDDSVTA